MESILQQFLSSQIINIEEDENHQKLIKASKDFTKQIEKDKTKFQKIAISAFDSNISIDDPNVIDIKNLIIKSWTTFINKCQNMPLTYIRAVMLESLYNLSSDPEFAAIIWLSASESSVFYKVESREREILVNLLKKCGERYEEISFKKWNVNILSDGLSIDLANEPAKKVLGVRADYLPEKMTEAVLSESTISNNASYGANTVQQNWAKEFGKLSGLAINALFTTITKQVNESLDNKADLSNYNSLANGFEELAALVSESVIKNAQIVDLKNKLLWFKESLYSESQKDSYRRLPISVSVFAMAADYTKLVPEYSPTSVEYFLAETLSKTHNDAESEITFDDLINLLGEQQDKLRPYFDKYSNNKQGRLTLINYIANYLSGQVSKSDLERYTGIPLESHLTWKNLLNWAYRELQAAKFIVKK